MQGEVVKVISNQFYVKVNNNVLICTQRGVLKKNKTLPLVGDKVLVDIEKRVIEKILPRKNSFLRPLVSNIEDMVICPASIPNASMAFVMKDDSMKSSVPKGSLVFVELNTIPLHRELGLVKYNDELWIRRLAYRKNKLVLKSDNLLTKDIVIENADATIKSVSLIFSLIVTSSFASSLIFV